jgi:hypothetical protein
MEKEPMPEQRGTWDTAEAERLFKTVATNVAILSTFLYVFGWLSFQMYLGSWGITGLSALAIRNVALGALFVVYVGAPLALVAMAVTAVRHSSHVLSKVAAGLAVLFFGILCTAAIWSEALAVHSYSAHDQRWPAILRAYHVGSDEVIEATILLSTAAILVYGSVVILWRRLMSPLGVKHGTIALGSIATLAGLIISLAMFSESVKHIPAAYGGGYYGMYVLAPTPAAQKALHGDSPAFVDVPARLLYVDGEAIYVTNTGPVPKHNAKEILATDSTMSFFIDTYMSRIALKEVIAMHRVFGDD